MIRRIFFLMITFFIIISGCSQENDKPRNKRFVVWSGYFGKHQTAFRKITKSFKSKYLNYEGAPELEVYSTSSMNMQERLISAVNIGMEPDVLRIDVNDVAFLAEDLLLPFDSFDIKKEIGELYPFVYLQNKLFSKTNNKIVNGHVYGYMDQFACSVLFYNKDLFDKAGLKEAPKTIDEFISYGKRLTGRKQRVYGFGLNIELWLIQPWVNIFGGEFYSETQGKFVINSDENIKAFTFLRDLFVKYKIEGGAWIPGGLTPEAGFINNNYSMILSGHWNMSNFKGTNFGVALIPAKGKTKKVANIGGSSYVIMKSSKNKELAYKFIKHLVSYESQKIWVETTGELSVNKKVNRQFIKSFSVFQKKVLEQLNYAKILYPTTEYSKLKMMINNRMNAILSGKGNIKNILDEINNEMNRVKK